MKNEENTIKAYSELMLLARTVNVEASPFLKTRVMARIKESQKRNGALKLWKILSGGLATLSAVLLVLLVSPLNRHTEDTALNAQVGKTVVLRIDADDVLMSIQDVTFAEVELPDGMKFESKRFPQVAQQNTLRLRLENSQQQLGYLPIPIRAHSDGIKTVQIRYLNSEYAVVAIRSVPVNFKNKLSLF